MTSAWGAPAAGAWANAVEEEEEKHGAIQAPVIKETEFPSLGEAAAVKETKKEKKKKQTMSLGEFVKSGPGGTSNAPILMNLPTAPRARQDGEVPEEKPLGGGFKGYGGQRGGRFDEDRPPRRPREEDMPSRADEVDDWTRGKGPSSRGPEPRGGRGFGGPRDDMRPGRGEPSRADMVDDWGSRRQFVPSGPGRDGPRRGGSRERYSRADTEERWGHRSDSRPSAFDDRSRRGPPGGDSWRGREQEDWRRDAPSREPQESRGERPKLNLKPRTKPVEPVPEIVENGARPSIFGEARPREEVLKTRPESEKSETAVVAEDANGTEATE